MTAAAPETLQAPETATEEPADADLVLADMLVEEISIDGMCGVY